MNGDQQQRARRESFSLDPRITIALAIVLGLIGQIVPAVAALAALLALGYLGVAPTAAGRFKGD